MANDSVDIIYATETHLSGETDAELELAEFNIHRRDRPVNGKHGGGVMIAIRKSLDSTCILKGKDAESIFCTITRRNKPPAVVACAYRPPDNNIEVATAIARDITDIRSKFKKSDFMMGGDFNLPDINWETFEIKGGNYSKNVNQIILDSCSDNGLRQTVTEPTRKDKRSGVENILDIFLTSNPNLLTKTAVVSGLGDHEAVRIESLLQLNRRKKPKREIRLWKQTDTDSLSRDAKNFASLFLATHTKLHSAARLWKCIKENLLALLDDHVPTKMTSTKAHQPWINTATKRLLRQKQKAYQKAKSTKSEKDWTRYRNIKKLTQKVCRNTHDIYVSDMISDNTDTKKLWSHIRSKNKDNVGISDLESGTTLIQDAETKANMFNTFFTKVFSIPDQHVGRAPSKKLPPMPKIQISQAGVLKLLLNIKENKATGPDGIPGNLIKMCAHELAPVFTTLFQASLDQGCVPPDWKMAHIVPVFKKGSKSKVENYRPISLTSITSKLLEHIVHSSVMDHLDDHGYLNCFQHGFRQNRSCESQLITTVRDFANCLNEQGQIDAILLDFSKAFDKVDHRKLLSKLSEAGIDDSLHQWTESFLSNREQSVLVDGVMSSPAAVTSGVPQGTVLGPLLFLIYINDISDSLTPGTVIRLFADDSLLYRTIKTREDHEILQKDLDALQAWETENKMEFHPGKCQVLRVTNKINPSDAVYSIHDTDLTIVKSAKYLGVIIDSKLNWSEQISAVCGKASGTLAFLQRNMSFCPIDVKEKCINTLVRPVLEYGCCVLDPHQANHRVELELVQRRSARFVTGNHARVHGNTEKNLNLLDWPLLETRRARAKLQILHKAIKAKSLEIPTTDLAWKIPPRSTRSNMNRLNFPVPRSNVDSHLHSFFPNTIRLWNALPEQAQAIQSYDSFKQTLKNTNIRSTHTKL